MEIVYTRHAKKRMVERKVTPKQVEDTLEWPDEILPGEYDEEIVTKQFLDREIRVICEEDPDRDVTVVYTVISKRIKGHRKGEL